MSLTINFHADSGNLAMRGDRPAPGTARAHHFGGGYFDQSAKVWSEDEKLLGVSHQVVYLKE